MPLPDPQPAMVIRYSYLWYSEFAIGREEGVKDRPCAIVAAVRQDEVDQWKVLVLPVTHSQPEKPEDAIEIPSETKQRLGLDSERSWVVITEWNEFFWPGTPDLRMVPGGDEKTVAYGFLPAKFFHSIKAAFLSKANQGTAQRIRRTQ